MTITPANFLTLSRLVLVPFFLAALIAGRMGLALTLFCIAGATDLVDGTVARKFGRPSRWGAMVDPLADKCLVQSCFISMGVMGVLPWWFVMLALVRDLMITGGILYLRRESARLRYRPAMVSKFATFFQLAVAILSLVYLWRPDSYLVGRPVSTLLMWLILVTAVLILISGIKYVSMGLEILKRHRASHA